MSTQDNKVNEINDHKEEGNPSQLTSYCDYYSIKIPALKESKDLPLALQETPIHLKEFNANLSGEEYKFQESRKKSSKYFYHLIGSKLLPNLKKRIADDCFSIKSFDSNDEVIPHKKLCPNNSDQEISTPVNENDLINSPNKLEERPLDSFINSYSENEDNLDFVLPSPSLSVLSNQENSELIPFKSPSDTNIFNLMPSMINNFENLHPKLQSYFVNHLLRRMNKQSLQAIASQLLVSLKSDFITTLPPEIINNIMEKLDVKSLCSSARVNKKWKTIITNNDNLWQRRIKLDCLEIDPEPISSSLLNKWGLDCKEDNIFNPKFNSSNQMPSGAKSKPEDNTSAMIIYKRRYETLQNWHNGHFRHKQILVNGIQVITCVQFDDEKIVFGSEASLVFVYDLHNGEVIHELAGHDGGVWTLQFVGNTLVTGSTDRTVRIWDLKKGICSHVFAGHTSTVRCLQIVLPMEFCIKNEYETIEKEEPSFPLVVTGSRDSTLRVWRLPSPELDKHENFEETGNKNPYLKHVLVGHTGSVRALAAKGNILASGSYDLCVRVWDLETGDQLRNMSGHTNKVYSIALDYENSRVISGSLDQTVRIWDIHSGTCIHVISDHTALVGLLQLSPYCFVSAGADATVRVWDPNTFECIYTFKGHMGAIMAFHLNGFKIISGSDGGIKLWDLHTGAHVRDLLDDISGVWQIKANSTHCVAAVTRDDSTWIDIMDFTSNNSAN